MHTGLHADESWSASDPVVFFRVLAKAMLGVQDVPQEVVGSEFTLMLLSEQSLKPSPLHAVHSGGQVWSLWELHSENDGRQPEVKVHW